MQQNGSDEDLWERSPTDQSQRRAGSRRGGLLERFGDPERPPSWPGSIAPPDQLGRNIALQRPDFGALLIRNASLRHQQGRADIGSSQRASAPQRAAGSQSQSVANREVSSSDRVAQKSGRSIFDIAGRFHDFQAGPKIARPNMAEEFIPVIGPAWDAVADVQDGNYGSAAFNAAMAAADVLPIGFGVKAVRSASKVTRALKTALPKAYAVQRKMHKLGLASTLDDVHHVFELNGIARNVQHWRNNPILLKVLPREVHQRLHHRVGDLPKFGLGPRLWHGTTDWMKAGAAGIGADIADAIENIENRSSATKKPIPQGPRR